MAVKYEDLLKNAVARGSVLDASAWFQKTFRDLSKDTDVIIGRSEERLTRSPSIGKMYLFHYDPKYKDVLPVYDRFPLIFPFEKAPNGFYGINFHYIPYLQRAKLLDELVILANNKGLTETTRLNLSYRLLKSVASVKFFEPCIKRYLNNHVRSRFLLINPSEWGKALMLPVEGFVYKK